MQMHLLEVNYNLINIIDALASSVLSLCPIIGKKNTSE